MKWKKYGPWWGRFTSALMATVCGIVFTFGIARCDTRRTRSHFIRTNEVVAMCSIQKSIVELDKISKPLIEEMPTVKSVVKMYPDSLKYVSDEAANIFISSFTNFAFYTFDNNAERMFLGSSDMWMYAKSRSEIAAISELFSALNLAQQLWSEIDNTLSQITNIKLVEIVGQEIAGQKALKIFFNSKSDVWTYNALIIKAELFQQTMTRLHQYYDKVYDSLGITENEIKNCTSDFGDFFYSFDSE